MTETLKSPADSAGTQPAEISHNPYRSELRFSVTDNCQLPYRFLLQEIVRFRNGNNFDESSSSQVPLSELALLIEKQDGEFDGVIQRLSREFSEGVRLTPCPGGSQICMKLSPIEVDGKNCHAAWFVDVQSQVERMREVTSRPVQISIMARSKRINITSQ